MDLYYRQEISVGLLVIAAVIVFFVGLMWLRGTPLGGGERVQVQVEFEDVSGLAKGDPVFVSGFNVGRVSNIEFQGVGRILVVLEVSDAVPPRADARASVAALDFLGQMKIDYVPGTSSEMWPAERVLTGMREAGLTEGVPELKDQASQLLLGLQNFTTPEMANNFNATLVALEGAVNRVSAILAEMPPGTGANVSGSLESTRRVMNHLDSILGNESIQESINQLDELTESLREMADGLSGTTTALSSVMTKIDSGQGTIGLALSDSTLHHDMHELLTAMTELLDDIRLRPGRYFRLKVF
jgi:phospholipid/cholesterol/gamma-HCH transport system substrate-binding protein